jgi:hypothetical protein
VIVIERKSKRKRFKEKEESNKESNKEDLGLPFFMFWNTKPEVSILNSISESKPPKNLTPVQPSFYFMERKISPAPNQNHIAPASIKTYGLKPKNLNS